MKRAYDLKEFLKDKKDGDKIFNFLSTANELTPLGMHEINDDCYINLISMQSKDSFDGILESHKQYQDVHCLLKGQEKLYYCDKKDARLEKEYDTNDDYELYKNDMHCDYVDCKPMQCVLFDVDELHSAGFSVGNASKILKAVIKIRT